MKDKKIILIIAAHPDDELLGCAATVYKYVQQGATAVSVILGEGLRARGKASGKQLSELKKHAIDANAKIGVSKVHFDNLPDNQFDSVPILKIIKIIEKYIAKYSPDIVFTHFSNDLNVDHQLTFKAVITACRPQPGFKHPDIYCFEVPSSTDYALISMHSAFVPNVYINIENEIDIKLAALAKYKTEMRSFPHTRSIAGIKILSQYRGVAAGLKFAEAFQLIRRIE